MIRLELGLFSPLFTPCLLQPLILMEFVGAGLKPLLAWGSHL